MSAVEDRLAAAGHVVPDVVPPVAVYVPALRSGNYVYVSGQLPMVNGQLLESGQVGANVTPERAKELAQACGLNVIAAIKSAVGDLDRVVRVVKVVGFVACTSDFTAVPGVVNGASELFGVAFGDAGVHARSAVGVAALPLGAPVEVEAVVEVAD